MQVQRFRGQLGQRFCADQLGVGDLPALPGPEHQLEQRRHLCHQSLIVETKPIPLEQRELRIVQPTHLAGAEHRSDLIEGWNASGQQPLQLILG